MEENTNQENPFPSMENYLIQKDLWFLVRLKNDIEIIEQNEIKFKRLTESLILVSFDTEIEAQNYFDMLNKQENIKFSIISDYTKC